MKTRMLIIIIAMLALASISGRAATLGTEFTYQGRLTGVAGPPSGSYDFTFALHLVASGVDAPIVTVTNLNTAVSNGLFTATVDFGGGIYNGNAYWISIGVRSNGTGLSFTALTPRQPLTPTPNAHYASLAGTVPGGSITANKLAVDSVSTAGLQNNAVTGAKIASDAVDGAKILNGSITSADLNASLLNNTFWKLTGNDVAPGQFIGSTNNQAVEFKVSGERALRLEPRGVGLSPNVLGGYYENTAGNFRGAAIAGGGTSGAINSADGNYSFIGAGIGGHTADSAAVVGGAYNRALGQFSFVGTGLLNTNLGLFAGIVAGTNNFVGSGAYSAFVGAGLNNQALGAVSTIGGGQQNIAIDDYPTIGGGFGNEARGGSSTVGGGYQNAARGNASAVGGGFANQANGAYSVVSGGRNNAATHYAFAAGRRAKANHTGAFVWADSTDADFASTATNQFSIRARGGVRLSDDTPDLSFGSTTRQMLNLWGTQYGIGVQSDTLYFRSDATPNGGFIWYKGGVHDGGYSQPGQGGVELMHLVNDRLYIQGSVVVDQAGLNNGIVTSAGLTFGTSSGEGIASRRTSGAANQYGLDFYTGAINRMTILNDGRVGIGTTAPASALHVVGNILASGNASVCALTIRGGCDLAEPFQMSGKDLPKGAVVVIDEANPGHLRLSESAYDTRVAGIISGANGVNPGISLHQEGVMEGGQNVALSGRVYVQADAANGPIKPGDLLTTSATPGHAMKVADHGKAQGAILGKAMTALEGGKGLVLVLVTLQ